MNRGRRLPAFPTKGVKKDCLLAGSLTSLPHAHNLIDHSDSVVDRSVADLALQYRLGLLPKRRLDPPDHIDPYLYASGLGERRRLTGVIARQL
jgi:hypothetical protein